MGIFNFFKPTTSNSLSGENSEKMFMLSCTACTLEFVFTNLRKCSNGRFLRTLEFIFTNRRMCSNNRLLFHLLFQLRIFMHAGARAAGVEKMVVSKYSSELGYFFKKILGGSKHNSQKLVESKPVRWLCLDTHVITVRYCGLVVSVPAWNGTGCEFDSWQCRIYIPCSLSLRLLGSLRGSLGTYGLTQKLC